MISTSIAATTVTSSSVASTLEGNLVAGGSQGGSLQLSFEEEEEEGDGGSAASPPALAGTGEDRAKSEHGNGNEKGSEAEGGKEGCTTTPGEGEGGLAGGEANPTDNANST